MLRRPDDLEAEVTERLLMTQSNTHEKPRYIPDDMGWRSTGPTIGGRVTTYCGDEFEIVDVDELEGEE